MDPFDVDSQEKTKVRDDARLSATVLCAELVWPTFNPRPLHVHTLLELKFP